jgi:hypothetical protein
MVSEESHSAYQLVLSKDRLGRVAAVVKGAEDLTVPQLLLVVAGLLMLLLPVVLLLGQVAVVA